MHPPIPSIVLVCQAYVEGLQQTHKYESHLGVGKPHPYAVVSPYAEGSKGTHLVLFV
jgi:hypothetical protein